MFVTALSVTASFFVLPEVTSFDLDGGATSVTSSMVTLDNTSSGAPLEYMASEASDFSGATWEPYDTAPIFTLSSGGTTTRFYWGDDPSYSQIGDYAWYSGNNSPNDTKDVGGKLPKSFLRHAWTNLRPRPMY